jgi:phage shock protein C
MQHVNDQRFYRGNDRIIGGVCSGLAEGFHIDPLVVRVLFVLLIFLQGVGVFLYVVLWLVMPERLEGGATRAGFDAMTSDLKRVSADLRRQVGSSPATSTAQAPTAQPASTPAAPAAHTQPRWLQQPSLIGLVLVVVGLVLLGSNIGLINWAVVWPAALITIGIVLLVRNLERKP